MHPTQLNLEDLVLLQKRMLEKHNKEMFTSSRSGGRVSAFKGRGMEFDEVRLYQPGDDIRQIDWRVTARTGKTHTKLFHEERDRAVWVCVDFSQSMFFATKNQYKSVLACYFGAYQLWLAYSKKDRCGGIVFNESEQYIVKPSTRRKGILHFLAKCVAMNNVPTVAEKKYDINHTIKELKALNKTGSLIVIISDFYQLNPQGYDMLLQLARHNEILLQWVVDPFELAPPKKNFNVTDGNNIITLFASKKSNRKQYQQNIVILKTKLLKLARHPSIKAVISNTKDATDLPRAINEA